MGLRSEIYIHAYIRVYIVMVSNGIPYDVLACQYGLGKVQTPLKSVEGGRIDLPVHGVVD